MKSCKNSLADVRTWYVASAGVGDWELSLNEDARRKSLSPRANDLDTEFYPSRKPLFNQKAVSQLTTPTLKIP